MGAGEAIVGIFFKLIGIVFAIAIKLLKPIGKILIYTGVYIPIVLSIATIIILEKGFDFNLAGVDFNLANDNTLGLKILISVFIIGCILAILTFIRNLARTITKDQTKGLFFFIPKKEKQGIQANYKAVSNDSGVTFGRKKGNLITKSENEDGHILVIGGAGSGKSSCIAIPSLLTWNQRVFAIDIKGELNNKTCNYRESSIVFSPENIDSPTFDPFKALQGSYNKVQDAREIALSLIPTPKNVTDPFWVESAQNLLTGAILHYSPEMDFIETMSTIQQTPVMALVDEIYNSDVLEAKFFVNQLIGLEPKTLSGIFTELSNKIMIFATDPDLKRALKRSSKSISPQDIENGKDIYINIPEYKIEQWKGLLTLIVNQFLKSFERRDESICTPVLFLLDEFARIGKIPSIENGLATLRSKKVTICILTQSLAQLDSLYGEEGRKIIADNCSYKAVLKATDADTQEYFSRLVGTYEKRKVSHNANFEQYSGLGRGTGVSKTTEEKRIIKPEEFAYLQDIILLSPSGYMRVDKTPYYADKTFIAKQMICKGEIAHV